MVKQQNGQRMLTYAADSKDLCSDAIRVPSQELPLSGWTGIFAIATGFALWVQPRCQCHVSWTIESRLPFRAVAGLNAQFNGQSTVHVIGTGPL